MKKKDYKVGDTVTAFLYNSSREKKKVKGKIKKINSHFGSVSYTITEGTVEDFGVRLVK